MTRAAVWKTSFLIHGSTQDAAYCLFSLPNIGRVRLNGNVRGRLAEVKTGSARARVQCHKTKGGEKMAKRENVLEKLIGAGNNPMVGMTVSVAVAIEMAAKEGKF